MQKQANNALYSNPVTDAAFAASRQLWLAGLGAAAYTREWARSEAAKNFRALVKEGAAVESQAVRVVGKRVQRSLATATSLWNQTRATAMTTATTLADSAAAALTKVRASVGTSKAPAKVRKTVKTAKAIKTAPKRNARTARRTKRGMRKA